MNVHPDRYEQRVSRMRERYNTENRASGIRNWRVSFSNFEGNPAGFKVLRGITFAEALATATDLLGILKEYPEPPFPKPLYEGGKPELRDADMREWERAMLLTHQENTAIRYSIETITPWSLS